jgi:hypothetical protein
MNKTAMPTMNLCSGGIKIRGRLCRIAHIDGDGYKFLDNPESLVAELRRSKMRAEASPKYPYLIEWDNMAVLPVSTFNHWWTEQIGFKVRNKAKQAEKRELWFGRAV